MTNLTKICVFFIIAFVSMQLYTNQLYAQPTGPGYILTYDDSGNRLSRTFTNVILKSVDTTMTETAVGNFNIKIYPNPTKGQLTLIIANLGSNDKVQLFLTDFSGNELARMDFSTAENTIDMSKHVNGTYFLRVVIGEQTETFKIIKME
ncbi:MAG: T9SS type A sorting domain-containing protein [Candidatus Kapabacteria bacterium]|nr:T9SS type A sorting domain-containing protein [Candidatus Kapabacteria bacterium]